MPEVFGFQWSTWGYLVCVFLLLVMVQTIIIPRIEHTRTAVYFISLFGLLPILFVAIAGAIVAIRRVYGILGRGDRGDFTWPRQS